MRLPENDPGNRPERRVFKRYVFLVLFGVLLYELFEYWNEVWLAVRWLGGVVAPVIAGVCIAFVINLPMRFFERVLTPKRENKILHRIRRPLSMAMAYLSVVAVMAALVMLLIPRIKESIVMLAANFEGYFRDFETLLLGLMENLEVAPEVAIRLQNLWNTALEYIDESLSEVIPMVLRFTVNLTSGLITGLVSVILSIFMLYRKEKLVSQMKDVIQALFPRRSGRIIEVCAMTNLAFNRFIIGQVTEALILGGLVFLGMSILNMPYALLISAVMAFTALVPILGPYVGTLASAFLILMIDPVLALWFVVFVIVLQQLESNIIYPKVVGNAIGLDSLWVLLAVVLGGGLFGLPGILLGVPLMSVAYRLVSEWVEAKKPGK